MGQTPEHDQKAGSAISKSACQSFKTLNRRLQWVYESKDVDELRGKYNAWANVYEADLKESWVLPMHTATLLETLRPHRDIDILDAGAGTGMVGAALNHLGYKNITAMDLSPEMLKLAHQKNVYKALYEANLDEELTFCESGSFRVITAIGVFTYGHVGSSGLLNLLPLLQLGGLFILPIRTSNEPMLSALRHLDLDLITQEIYELDEHPFYLMAYQKNNPHNLTNLDNA
mgnify:CR=1 FL=1